MQVFCKFSSESRRKWNWLVYPTDWASDGPFHRKPSWWMHFDGEGKEAEKTANVPLLKTGKEKEEASEATGTREAFFLFL